MPRWMKQQRLLTINLSRGLACITESVLIWDIDDDGQRGEAEKKREQYHARRNRETAERAEAGSKEST